MFFLPSYSFLSQEPETWIKAQVLDSERPPERFRCLSYNLFTFQSGMKPGAKSRLFTFQRIIAHEGARGPPPLSEGEGAASSL